MPHSSLPQLGACLLRNGLRSLRNGVASSPGGEGHLYDVGSPPQPEEGRRRHGPEAAEPEEGSHAPGGRRPRGYEVSI